MGQKAVLVDVSPIGGDASTDHGRSRDRAVFFVRSNSGLGRASFVCRSGWSAAYYDLVPDRPNDHLGHRGS